MVEKASRPLCRAIRQDGTPCQASAIVGEFCFGHAPAPELAEKRAEARRRGGHNKASSIRLRHLTPPKLIPIFDTLEAALDEVHSGSIDPRQAIAMAALGRALTAILTAGELEERVRALEGKETKR